jgi:2-methylcitrate dehydratase PrpD
LFGKESQKPPTVVIAQLSGAFCVASAIIHCELNLNNFTEEEIRNAKILQLAEKIKGKTELELNRERVDDPVIVDIKTNSGSVSSKRVENAYGSPERPSSLDDVTKKFRHCCDFAGVEKDKQDKVVKMVKGLEDVADVGEIIRLLA